MSAGDEGAPHVVLVGLMGSGKSTVGHRLAAHLSRRFVDLDDVIEAEEGRTIPEIFAADGEEGFRDREEQALVAVLDGDEPVVLATGGGAVLRPANRARMRKRGRVVWLRARADTLAQRVGHGEGRPLLAGPPDDVVGRLTTLAAERADDYAAAAHDVIDVDLLTHDEVVEHLEGRWAY